MISVEKIKLQRLEPWGGRIIRTVLDTIDTSLEEIKVFEDIPKGMDMPLLQ